MRIANLFVLVNAVCPIVSLNSDGVIVYAETATPAQQQAAQAILAANTTTPTPAELHNEDLLFKIAELEGKTERGVREFMLALLEREAIALGAQQGLTAPQSLTVAYSSNILYRKAKDVDNTIVALRAQLL